MINNSKKYDVIIIGAGIGGLVCGCFLAKAGLKVLIVEQHDKPGGCVSAIKKEGCVFDMGAHLFGSCNPNGILGQCLSKIDIEMDFIRLNPTDRFFFPDDTIDVPNNLDTYVQLLKDKFPNEFENIDIFFKELLYIAKHFTNKTKLAKYRSMTYQQFLDTHFTDNKLKGILSGQYLYIGARPKSASLLFMSVLLASYLKDGIYYPKGGTQVFSDTLNKKFNDLGGESVFKNRVTRIITSSDHHFAEGIELSDTTRIYSKLIIANSDAEETFFNLIDTKYLPKDYILRLKNCKKSMSLFLLFFAIKDYVFDASKYRGWHFNSYDMNNSENNSLYIFIPTLFDSSLAPKGIQIVESLIEFPYLFDDISDWHNSKISLQQTLFTRLEGIMGSLKQKLYYIDSASPATFEKFTLNSKGAVYGWEMTPNQISENRLQQETPFENLYLVGHWTVPGCGIPSVAVSGWLLSKKILEKYKKSSMGVLT